MLSIKDQALSLQAKLLEDIPKNATTSILGTSSFTISNDGQLFLWGYMREKYRGDWQFRGDIEESVATPFTNVMACAVGWNHVLMLQGIGIF